VFRPAAIYIIWWLDWRDFCRQRPEKKVQKPPKELTIQEKYFVEVNKLKVDIKEV